MISRVAEAVRDFNRYASDAGITQPWRSIIRKTLTANLMAFGFLEKEENANSSFCDKSGRTVDNLTLSVNSKGYLEVSALVNGKRARKFIRPNMPLYPELTKQDILDLPLIEKIRLVETLFPSE